MKRLSRWLIILLLTTLHAGLAVADAPAAAGPSVLIASPKGVTQAFVDLDWLRELHGAGFEPDYLDGFSHFTWDRIRQYDVLVLYGCPGDGSEIPFAFPKSGHPNRDEYIALLDRYLEAGGGLFVMVYTDSGDKDARELIEPWGARLPVEFYIETDEEKIEPLPRMDTVNLALVDQVLPSPITEGVENLWWPYDPHYHTSFTGPIEVSDGWTVVVKGSRTSHSEPVVPEDHFINTRPHPDPLVRPGGVPEPDLMAIRPYKNGRILLCSQAPMFSVGQGTHWLYGRRCLSKGLKGIPSDYERLIRNAFRWLAEPAMQSEAVGGYRATSSRFDPPNLKPDARKDLDPPLWTDEALDPNRPPQTDPVFRGLIGAQSAAGGGQGTVAEYAAAAREAGLDFVIFLEQFALLTPESLTELGEQCRKHSDDTLLLLPGYSIDSNIGNHMFFTGHDLPWPTYPGLLTGPDNKLLNLQPQDEDGTYIHLSLLTGWILSEHDRYGKNMIGFYNFDEPTAMQLPDIKDAAAAAIRFYRDGELVEDLTEEYLTTVLGTCPPSPLAINEVRSPDALIREIRSGNALTYAQGKSLPTLVRDTLHWNGQSDALNMFSSDGPIIHSWPKWHGANVYGSEPFVADRELMVSDLVVTSDVGLREIRIMDGHELVRRYLPGGAKEYRQILHLPGIVQTVLVLIAEDVDGGKAVSFPRFCWKYGSRAVVYCGDHVNDCGFGYLARGTGMFNAHRYPLFSAGFTWDGGPFGLRPILHMGHTHPRITATPRIIDYLYTEGGWAFHNIPVLEFADDQAIVVQSSLREVYHPKLAVMNAWHAFGPKEPSRLIDSERRYVEYNRPLQGVRRTGWAAIGERGDAVVANFSNAIRFKMEQQIDSLVLLRSNWNPPRPGVLVVGRGDATPIEHDLMAGIQPIAERVETGGWFGFCSQEAFNGVLFVNRGEPVFAHVDYKADGSFRGKVTADLVGQILQPGDSRHYEFFTVNESIDMEDRGTARFQRVLRYLDQPDGLQLIRGTREDSRGIMEVNSGDANSPVEIKVSKPDQRIGLTIPLRVSGLNPRWSAGLLQVKGHSTGYYTNGENVYSALGFDLDGRVYAALYPDYADETHVVVGHPVVCDQSDLFLEVMPRSGPDGIYIWHVAVNNPTDDDVTAEFRQSLDLPGLAFETQVHTVPAGGHLVMQR